MRRTRSPYLAAMGAAARRTLGVPAELAVRVLFFVVILVVFTALWKVATAARGGSIAGYDYLALMWFITAAEGSVIATKPRMIEEIGNDIGSGAIATEMLRPVSVVGLRLAVEMGEAIVRLACAALVAFPLIWLVAGPPPDAGAALLAVPSLVLAVACNLAAQHAFAATAFWLNDSKAAWFLYQKLVFLLGGMLLPLEFFPTWLLRTARALPFWTMAYAPGRLLSGHPDWTILAGQAGWLVALAAIAVGVFSLGERRLQSVGG